MRYRVLLPAAYDAGARRSASLYLLHGYGGAFSNWETHTRLADHMASYDVVIVLPEGQHSDYANAVSAPTVGTAHLTALSRSAPRHAFQQSAALPTLLFRW
ncbi:MAG: hypothetical protein ACYC3F_13120 [Gemmatimonadaceae bacterium]